MRARVLAADGVLLLRVSSCSLMGGTENFIRVREGGISKLSDSKTASSNTPPPHRRLPPFPAFPPLFPPPFPPPPPLLAPAAAAAASACFSIPFFDSVVGSAWQLVDMQKVWR